MLNIACLLSGKSSAHDCYPTDKPSVSAVLFGCHGINLLKNLVSRELLRILENFHFSISISKHFDFTFHFSKKSESILFSLCTSRKRVKAFFFTLHFSKKSESFLFSLFTSRTSKTHSRWSLLQSTSEYYRVLQNIREYYRVLQSITETNLAHLLGPIFGLVRDALNISM